jgi:hypothetical protein
MSAPSRSAPPPRRAVALLAVAMALLLAALTLAGLAQPPWLAGTDPQELEDALEAGGP